MQSIPRLSSTSINNKHLQTRAGLPGCRRRRPARSTAPAQTFADSAVPFPCPRSDPNPTAAKPLLLTFIKAGASSTVTEMCECQRRLQRAPEACWHETDAQVWDSCMWWDGRVSLGFNWLWTGNRDTVLVLVFYINKKTNVALLTQCFISDFILELLRLYFQLHSHKTFKNTRIFFFPQYAA